ncbi:DUF4394 domain-containing protein [Hymenobacter sp. BT188]|uniref:DUF4394 domain-containing protein n=1 Tax=Hymenobacter sp. BT188 TaxID=2763504 RepID=UPI0016512C69|nr:DUF4394 domain-containing protein [Hymenobacter sp. BT188]MBC6607963.1 DUF4394 domain-containing protein [Hymenobacter sp. BT188]
MRKQSYLVKFSAFALALSSLTSCEDVLEQYLPQNSNSNDKPVPSQDIPFYALSGGVKLDLYSTKNPARSSASTAITGLQAGEKLLGIDFRPATGQLYGIGSTSRLYVINTATGAARAIGSGPITPALEGDMVAFDFNPTVDRIRVVTSTGQNLRLNPETAAGTIVDGSINGVPGAGITGAAYTNSVAGASTTVLYDLDPATNTLYRQDPPNNGTLVAVGDLKLDISGNGGFDIDAKTGTALALFDVNGKPTLFTVDLATGGTKTLVKYDNNAAYTGLAIPTQPVAYAVSANNLLIFNPTNPSAVVTKPITGLASGDNILGLDFRPVNGQLYALGSGSRLYTINASSGAAATVATLSTTLAGTSFGFDFNPVVDRIRIISNTGQNLRVNPADGVAIVDGSLNPGTPAVSAAAYENNFAGTTATNLFVIDYTTDKLYLQNPPNNGTLVEIGSLGINVDAANGYDIGGTSNTGYAILTASGATKLYSVSKSSGAVMALGDFAGTVNGFAVGLGF